MKDVIIKTVPNSEIKKRKGFTGADWWFDPDGTIQIRVAEELPDWRERAALALHELAEILMCKHDGVTVEMVDDFDAIHQENGEHGLNAGDEPDAPYRVQHTMATAIERVFAGHVGIDWKGYDERLGAI